MSVVFISSTSREAGQALVGPHSLDSSARAWRTLSMPSWFTTEDLPSAGSWPSGGGGAAALITLFLARCDMAARAGVGVKTCGSRVGGPELCVEGRMVTGDKGHDVFTQVQALSMEVIPYSCLIKLMIWVVQE